MALFFWLLFGDFAWSMRDRSIGQMAAWYLNHLKVPNLVFGLFMSSLPVLVGLILGPVISVKSDRHRGGIQRDRLEQVHAPWCPDHYTAPL